jgi:hypothetical protein
MGTDVDSINRKPVDATLRPSLFDRTASADPTAEVSITLSVEPSRLRPPGRAQVVVRVLRQGRPVDGFPVAISCTRGELSHRRGVTRHGVLVAELRGEPEDLGTATVRVHSDLWEAQAVLSAGLEFVR